MKLTLLHTRVLGDDVLHRRDSVRASQRAHDPNRRGQARVPAPGRGDGTAPSQQFCSRLIVVLLSGSVGPGSQREVR